MFSTRRQDKFETHSHNTDRNKKEKFGHRSLEAERVYDKQGSSNAIWHPQIKKDPQNFKSVRICARNDDHSPNPNPHTHTTRTFVLGYEFTSFYLQNDPQISMEIEKR